MREAGDAVGQQDSVDAILNVGVVVADVKVALARGVLVDARKLQNEVAQLNGICLRDVLDVPLSEFIGTGASLWQDDIVAPLVEVLGLLDDLTIGRGLDLLRGRRRLRGRADGAYRWGSRASTSGRASASLSVAGTASGRVDEDQRQRR